VCSQSRVGHPVSARDANTAGGPGAVEPGADPGREDARVMDAPPLRTARFAELTPAELYGILRLRVDVFVVEQACAYPELDGRDAEPGTVHLWHAADDGTVLSTIRVLDNGAERSIGRVATAVGARGRGLSAALIRRGIELCGGRTIDIGAQAYLETWYERFGFRRSGPDYLEDGILHLPMRRSGGAGQ
jgi:ElaA protein